MTLARSRECRCGNRYPLTPEFWPYKQDKPHLGFGSFCHQCTKKNRERWMRNYRNKQRRKEYAAVQAPYGVPRLPLPATPGRLTCRPQLVLQEHEA